MSKILILYSTVDGHTLRICERLCAVAEGAGHRVTVLALKDNAGVDLAPYDKIVIGASIRYGKHRPYVIDFMRARRALLEAGPCAFFSVNIVARKSTRNTPDTNPYVRKLIKVLGWRPAQLGVFAGKLDYPRYGFWDRHIIRFIMLLTRGPTDPAAVIDFTDWDQVEAFGLAICEM